MPDYSQYAQTKNDSEPEQEESNHTIEFVGDMVEFRTIVLKNILLMIVTLGIYRFWAKTNVRRYIWSHTLFDSEPFEYTGTGKEIFLGFVIVLVILGSIVGLFAFLINLLSGAGQIALIALLVFGGYITAGFLVGVAIYRAKVYRMSRTRWRGIRGAQVGSSMDFGVSFFLRAILLSLTANLIYPSFDKFNWNYDYKNKRIGKGRFSSLAESGPVYGRFFLCVFIGVILFSAISYFMSSLLLSNTLGAEILYYVLILLALSVLKGLYNARRLPYFISQLKFNDLGMQFDTSSSEMMKFEFINFVIIIFSLGLAAPFVQFRWANLIANRLEFSGNIDVAQITQSPEEEPRFGEGLAEAFDVG